MCPSPPPPILDRRRVDFPPGPGGNRVGDGIAFTRRVLARWHPATERAAEEAVLVVAELLANAEDHAGGPLALDLEQRPDLVRIAVVDADPAPPRLDGSYRPDTPHGHGLVIVDRICVAWDSAPDGGGKRVWADVVFPTVVGPDPGPAHRAALADPDPLFDA